MKSKLFDVEEDYGFVVSLIESVASHHTIHISQFRGEMNVYASGDGHFLCAVYPAEGNDGIKREFRVKGAAGILDWLVAAHWGRFYLEILE